MTTEGKGEGNRVARP